MMSYNRNTRRSRNATADTDRFSEQARKSRREYSASRSSSSTADAYRLDRRQRDDSPSGQYSRRVSQAEYTRKAKARKRKQTILIGVAAVFVLVLAGAGLALAYYNTVSNNLHEGLDPDLQDVLVKTDLAKEPFYMVLMGTDGSNDRAQSAEYEGDNFRSDSLMLARIDPVNKKVTLVSIPRDTLVDLGEYGQNKINAAHAFGGASLTVETVSELAGVPISHYAEINFDGFRDIVNALGGVEVDVPMEIDDADAGGYLAAGTQVLNGDQALILCRSRHAYDEYGAGDLYRAANQRLVLAAIAKKILASDLATLASTVTALSDYVTTDLDVMDIVGLAQTMRGLDSKEDIYSAVMPTESQYISEGWYEIVMQSDWKKMMQRVGQGLPPTEEDIIDETGTVLANAGGSSSSSNTNTNSNSGTSTVKRSGAVAVKNGSGIDGVATAAGEKLTKVGYTVETGNADDYEYPETLVIYDTSAQAAEAKEIVATLGVGRAVLNDGTYAFDGDFLVVIGSDWG